MTLTRTSRGALALLAAAPPLLAQGPPPSPVRVDPVRQELLQDRRIVTGDLRAARVSTVASEEAGRVVALEVDEGQRVSRGDVLARLDPTRLELELAVLGAQHAAARATLLLREGELEQEERDLATVQNLAERNAANAKEVADQGTAVANARARAAEAGAEIEVLAARADLLGRRLEDTTIRAPFDGLVSALSTELGQWVASGGEVVELVASELEAWIEVPERFLPAVLAQPGPLSLRVADLPEQELADWRAVPIVAPDARAFPIIARVPAAAGLAPGMSVTAWVPTGSSQQHLTVSTDALLRNEAGAYLYVAAPGPGEGATVAMPVQVQVLFRSGDRAVVAGGALQPGAQAIVEGNQRLFPMAPVRPVEAGSGEGR
ncbi:MAG: efflux RND transporter periplasmic adaptor subunit [Planctomycetota bacterium]